MSICIICGKTFLGSSKTCSKRCGNITIKTKNKQHNDLKLKIKTEEYYKTPKLCLHCNQLIPYEKRCNKFCSNACSAIKHNSGSVKSLKQRKLISDSLKKFNENKKTYCEIFYCTCIVCNSNFITNKTKSINKCCSKTCFRKSCSKSGKKSAQTICKRSKDEIILYDLCASYFKKVEHNIIIKDGWDADILIYDTKTAVLWNGPWHYKDMKMSNHYLSQVQNRDKIKISVLTKEGWNVKIFEDRYYNPKSAFEELKGKTWYPV